jgi:uncharacterized protein (TIGR00297 family)
LQSNSYNKKKLTKIASLTAFLIGMITISAGIHLYMIVLSFFLTSTYATKMGKELKIKFLSAYKKEKTRDVYQVLCNGGLPTLFAFFIFMIDCDLFSNKNIFGYDERKLKIILNYAYVYYYAACNADTWSSEIGFLSKGDPILITKFKNVPRGTNGGISKLGILVSIAGGALIGFVAGLSYQEDNLFDEKTYLLLIYKILICSLAGLSGSILDSILGATLQETIYLKNTNQIISREEIIKHHEMEYIVIGRNLISNNLVNFISASIISITFVLSKIIKLF